MLGSRTLPGIFFGAKSKVGVLKKVSRPTFRSGGFMCAMIC
jgi:hypothetical protein